MLLTVRNAGLVGQVLTDLTTFANKCLGGYLPAELQPFLCAGRLIPLVKKDNGTRPSVVGEMLRAMFSSSMLSLAEISGPLQALQPLQIGAGGKGPLIQAAILAGKSWISTMAPG